MNPEFPFIFKPENIARYEDGDVVILDRSVYPFEIEYVRCCDYEETARAIEDMVTQSYGPGFAAGYAMASAARRAIGNTGKSMFDELERAGKRLVATRPTNHQIRLTVARQLEVAARYFDIPTYIFCPYGPDREAGTIDDIEIEERDPQEVLESRGLPTTDARVNGYYPAFDATPPALITGLITDRGLFAPDDTWGYYETQTPE